MQDKLYFELGGRRAVAIGRYVAETGATVRQAAAVFGISKSTAHKDLTVRRKYENSPLYSRVARVLQKNKAERHIRGGLATREKYMQCKNSNFDKE